MNDRKIDLWLCFVLTDWWCIRQNNKKVKKIWKYWHRLFEVLTKVFWGRQVLCVCVCVCVSICMCVYACMCECICVDGGGGGVKYDFVFMCCYVDTCMLWVYIELLFKCVRVWNDYMLPFSLPVSLPISHSILALQKDNHTSLCAFFE